MVMMCPVDPGEQQLRGSGSDYCRIMNNYGYQRRALIHEREFTEADGRHRPAPGRPP